MQDLIGHESARQFFDTVRKHDRLSHAYILVGQESIGKHALAQHVAAQVLGIGVDSLTTHPDVHEVAQEQDRKTGKTKKDIGIGQIQELCKALSQSPFVAQHNIGIVDQAQRMSIAASNALLKNLEEPPSKSLLFLLTTDEQQLPATIRSRCQTVYLYPVASAILEQTFATEQHAQIQEFITQARGCPGKVLRWLATPEEFTQHSKEVSRFASLIDKTFHDKLEAVNELFGDKTDHIAARDRLVTALRIWQSVLHDWLHASSAPLSRQQLLRVYDAIDDAARALQKNIHPRLLIENILLHIP